MQIKRFIKGMISAFIFVFMGLSAASAATTIGTNITTTGTLSVTGATTMSAALTLTSTTNPQVTVKYDTANYLTTYIGSTGIVTLDSVGSAIRNAFTFSDTVTVATTTSESLLAVDGSTSSTTLAVYQRGAGDIVNVFDSATEVFTILDGGKIGVGSSTPYALLSVEALTGQNALIVGSSTAELFKINASGAVSFNGGGWPSADFTVQGDSQTNLFMVDASADRVGIASSTPHAVLSVEALTGQNAFIVGSSTAELFKINASGVVSFNGGGWPSADFTVQGDAQANLFQVDASADRIGIASSTPYAVLSVAALAGQQAIVVGSSTAELFKIDNSGAVSFNGGGWPSADFTIQGDTLSNLVTVDASADRVGIASSTPWGLLAVEQATETYSLVVGNQGSTTPSFVINGVNGMGRVGIGTSSPSALFSIGKDTGTATGTMFAIGFNGTSNGTTTIDLGKPCFRLTATDGTVFYMWPQLNANDKGNWATSTTSCF